MKYNGLILNASDRINRNDLRFFLRGVSAKIPPPNTSQSTLLHKHTSCSCAVISLVGGLKTGERTAVIHCFTSLIYVQSSLLLAPGKSCYCVCQHCALVPNKKVIISLCCCCFPLTLSRLSTELPGSALLLAADTVYKMVSCQHPVLSVCEHRCWKEATQSNSCY